MAKKRSRDDKTAASSAGKSANALDSDERSGKQGGETALYDFSKPARFSKDHLRTFGVIHTGFATALTAALSGLYQVPTQVALTGVDQVAYKEYRESMPSNGLLSEVGAEPLSADLLLQVDAGVVGTWVDYLSGGNPQIPAEPGELSPVDLAVAERVLSLCVEVYAECWSGLVALRPEVRSVVDAESYEEMLLPTDIVLVCSFEIHTGESVGNMTICIPAAGVESVLPALSAARGMRASSRRQDKSAAENIRRILETIALPCSVVLGRAGISLPEAVNLEVGDVIRTTRRADSEVELWVSSRHMFNCRPGVRGKDLAVMVCSAAEPGAEDNLTEAPPELGDQTAAEAS